ncbi:MAG: acyl--CoA ligase, partial [Nitrospirae bacterium]
IIVPISTRQKHEIDERINTSYTDKKIYAHRDGYVVEDIGSFREKHEIIRKLQESGRAGLILFSSGSTGKPKAIVEDLDGILEHYKRGHGAYRTLVFLMFDHIGGINTMFHILTSGGMAVLPEKREPEHVCELIERYRVEVLPTSPTFLNLIILSGAYKSYDLSSLKLITYGTETMPESLLRRIKQILPKVRLKQTFGTSETGILSTRSKSDESLFMKMGGKGFEYKIVDGQLFIKSETAMLGYLNAENPFTEDGWFPTGDIVEVDEDGYIRIIGRKNEVINVGGLKVMPSEVESVILDLPFISDVLVYGEKNPITGQSIAVDVVLNEDMDKKEVKKEIRKVCLKHLDRYKVPTNINIVDKINIGERFKKIRR